MKLILRYMTPYKWRVFLGMFSKFIGTVTELLIPSLLATILDSVIPQNSVSLVYVYGAFMLGCALFALFGNIFANRLASAVARDVTFDLRHDLFDKITRLTSREMDRLTIPSLISRMTTDTYYIYRMVGMIQRIGIRAPILLIGGIIITMIQDAVLSSLLLAILPFMALIVYIISKKGVPLYAKLQQYVDDLVRVVREDMSGVRIIKALSKTEDEKKRFGKINEKVTSSETKASYVMSVNGPLMQFLLNTGLVLVVVVGAGRVNSGLSKPGSIIAFLSYFTIILNAMLTITRILTMYSKALASAERIGEVLNAQTESNDVREDQPSQTSAPVIEFKNVSFSYHGKMPDLQDISFSLKKGERLGILGPTGSGKSTLIKLLMRLYDANEGEIWIDGKRIEQYSLEELRSKFGVVFQNDTIFRGTIEDNITLGRKISLNKVTEALTDAQAIQFVDEKGGPESEVVSRGHNFSGGQQQRMLIARALAGTPEILILDDAASALDFVTEANLRKTLNQKYADTVTVIVAQRISAVMHCDRILMLENGQMLGLGTHDELMKTCDVYKEIAMLQLGGDKDDE